jgi:serine/threonine protein kinase
MSDPLEFEDIQRERTFHTKESLSIPTYPLKNDSLLGGLWRKLPTSFRLSVYRLLVRIGRRLYGVPDIPRTQRLPFNLYAKFDARDLSEALTTMFIAANTTIPVPRILDVFPHTNDPKQQFFVIMTRMPGTESTDPFKQLDAKGLARFDSDLQDWLFQLRSLRPPPSVKVSNLLGGPFIQYSLADYSLLGPFEDTRALHQFILDRVLRRSKKRILKLAPKSYRKPHRLCFSHGDLRPENILMHNGRLSGLIAWETGGWFPEYWDSVTGRFQRSERFKEVMGRILPKYEDEYEVQYEIWDVLRW